MPPRKRGGLIVGARAAATNATAATVAAAQLSQQQQQQQALLFTLIQSNNFDQVKKLVNGEMWTIPDKSDLLGKALLAALRGRNAYKIVQFFVTDVGVPVLGEYEDEASAAGGAVGSNLSTPLGKALTTQDVRGVMLMLRKLEGGEEADGEEGGLARMKVAPGERGTLLGQAVEKGQVEVVKLLVEKDWEGSQQLAGSGRQEENVLFRATVAGQKQALMMLCEGLTGAGGGGGGGRGGGRGAGRSSSGPKDASPAEMLGAYTHIFGRSLVHEAVRAGKVDCLTWLVAGTGGGQAHELHVPDTSTHLLPIHMAAMAGDHKMLRYIVANLGLGADILTGDNQRCTALQLAVKGQAIGPTKRDEPREQKRYLTCCKFLVEEAGASMSIRDASGANALDCAQRGKMQAVIDYLENVAQIDGMRAGAEIRAAMILRGKEKRKGAQRKGEEGAGDANGSSSDEMSSSSGGEEAGDDDDDDDIPDDLRCALSFELMTQPVVAADGRSYQKKAFETLIAHKTARGEDFRSPYTNEPMAATYFDNHNLRLLALAYQEKHERAKKEAKEERVARKIAREVRKRRKEQRKFRRQQQLQQQQQQRGEGGGGDLKRGGSSAESTDGSGVVASSITFLKQQLNHPFFSPASSSSPTVPNDKSPRSFMSKFAASKKQSEEEARAFCQRVCSSAMLTEILLEDYGDEFGDYDGLEFFVEELCEEDVDGSTRAQFQKMLQVEEALVRAQLKEQAKEEGQAEEKKTGQEEGALAAAAKG